jgi:tetratricopeptide (TPR) repeat protein
MNEAAMERFNDVYGKFEAGSRSEALKGLQDLLNSLDDPWEKTALLYHETLFLVEMEETKKARECLDSFKAMLSSLGEPPTDGYQDKLPNNLAVMAGYTEMRVLLAEKKETEALKRIEDLVSQYPKQLSISGFDQILGEIQTHRGFLLVNAGRYAEAKTILENSSPPRTLEGDRFQLSWHLLLSA